MQIESLRYFVELAEAGSFYGAARRAFLSQQGLNKAITSLEAELGVTLVERYRRGVRLTNAGDIFLDYARSALAEHNAMLDELYAENRYSAPGAAPLVFHVTYYPAQISRPFIDSMDAVDLVRLVEEPFQQLLENALTSDGNELFLADLYAGTRGKIAAMEGLVFEPILASQFGVVWKDGSPLEGKRVIHREQLADFPLAVDSHREMLQLVHSVMQDYPLNDIRLGVAEPRSTLEYAAKSNQAAATFDSFGFELACASPSIHTEGLHFTPFSTPRSLCQVGFLYAKGARPNMRCRHAIDRIRRYLADAYADYLARYPLES